MAQAQNCAEAEGAERDGEHAADLALPEAKFGLRRLGHQRGARRIHEARCTDTCGRESLNRRLERVPCRPHDCNQARSGARQGSARGNSRARSPQCWIARDPPPVRCCCERCSGPRRAVSFASGSPGPRSTLQALFAAALAGAACIQLGFIAHDAGHGSVGRSRRGNGVAGHLAFTLLNGLGFRSWVCSKRSRPASRVLPGSSSHGTRTWRSLP